MSNHSIPSDEDFARARAAMRRNDRGLGDVRERVLERFREFGVHEVFIFYSPGKDAFVAYTFYEVERQIADAERSGLGARIMDAVYEELEDVGRGSRDSLRVDFEFDSHESVERNYEGDYFLRLR